MTLTWHTLTDFHDAPGTCGVYQYWAGHELLYIGKAVNLKARLASHAQNARLDAKEAAIVYPASEIRYTEVDSEFKALLLEAELIRTHRPPYNRVWKDDKTYLYIVIDLKDPFPRPHFARAHDLRDSLYGIRNSRLRLFGPFPNSRIAEEVLRAIRRLIPFCMARRVGKHPCFYSRLGLCNPCPSAILKLEPENAKQQTQIYRRHIRQVLSILSGKIDPVIKELEASMKEASAAEDYETALKLRTKIERFSRYMATHTFRESETIAYNTSASRADDLQNLLKSYFVNLKSLHRIECYDASQNGMHDAVVSMVVAVDGLMDHGAYRRFKVKNVRAVSDFDRLEEALARRLKNARWESPDLIVIDGGTPQLRRLQRVFDQLPDPPLYVGLAKHPDHLILPDLQGQALQGSNWITVKLDQTGPAHALLAQLRDEAHRFANSYRKVLEKKRTLPQT